MRDKDDKVVTVAGDHAHPVNRGRLCPKGLSEHHILDAPGRLTTPTVDGAPVSWDAALDKVVGDFQRILHDHGPRSEEHTSELQSLMRISYAVFCLNKKKTK